MTRSKKVQRLQQLEIALDKAEAKELRAMRGRSAASSRARRKLIRALRKLGRKDTAAVQIINRVRLKKHGAFGLMQEEMEHCWPEEEELEQTAHEAMVVLEESAVPLLILLNNILNHLEGRKLLQRFELRAVRGVCRVSTP